MKEINQGNLNKFVISVVIIGVILILGIYITDAIGGVTKTTGVANSISNEAGFSSSIGYTLSKASVLGFSSPVITGLLNGTTALVTVTNETGLFSNSSGSTLATASNPYFTSPVLIKVYNYTDDTNVALGNFTLSAAGLLTNASEIKYDNLSVTYTYIPVVAVGNVSVSSIGVVTNVTAAMPSLLISYTYSATNDTTTSIAADNITSALSTGTAWISILVVVGFATIILSMLTGGLGAVAKEQPTTPYY